MASGQTRARICELQSIETDLFDPAWFVLFRFTCCGRHEIPDRGPCHWLPGCPGKTTRCSRRRRSNRRPSKPGQSRLTSFRVSYIGLQSLRTSPSTIPLHCLTYRKALTRLVACRRQVLFYYGYFLSQASSQNPVKILSPEFLPIPCYFIYIIASAVSVTLAHLTSACSIFPLRFSRQSVAIGSRIDRYRPFYIIKIAKFRVRLIIRVFLILVYVVIRFQTLFYTPLYYSTQHSHTNLPFLPADCRL